MLCDQTQALMDRYANGELTPDQGKAFEGHLDECGDCRQRLADLQRLVATLRSIPSPPVPDGLVDCVVNKARREVQSSRSPLRGLVAPRRWRVYLAAGRIATSVSAVAAGILIGLVLGRQAWQSSVDARNREIVAVEMNGQTADSLDLLSGFPRRSFTETYLSMTGVTNKQEH